MKKILISGYYGFGNIGDEAILQSMIEELNKHNQAIDITVLSHKPDETQKHFHVKAVNRSSLITLISSVKKCDVLVSGGGSLLQESTGRLSIFYYLFIYFLAMVFHKKIIIFSHGIGPVYRKLSKRLIKFVFNRVASISVRDERSKVELIEYGVKGDKIDVTADPVISFSKFGIEKGQMFLKEHITYDPEAPTIGFALKNNKTNCISEQMVQVIDLLKIKHCNIVLIPFHFTEDQHLINEIMKLSNHDIITATHRQTVDEMFSLIENLDVLVGVRLHALIFSAVVETPIVGISYDPKIDAFLASIEETVACSIDNIDVNLLVNSIQNKIENKEEISKKIKKDVKVYKDLLEDFNQSISSVLD